MAVDVSLFRPELKEFASDSTKAVLEAILEDVQPRLVLLGSTSIGLELLGLISARKGVPCLDNCTPLESRDGQLVATCQIDGGKVFVEVALAWYSRTCSGRNWSGERRK